MMLDKISKIVFVLNLAILLSLIAFILIYKNYINTDFTTNSTFLYYISFGAFFIIFIYTKFKINLKSFAIKFSYLFLFTILNIGIITYNILKLI